MSIQRRCRDLDFRLEPHLLQNRHQNVPAITVYPWEQLERILHPDAPRKAYYRIPAEQRSTNHWGQRKLLLAEIEFLSHCGNLGKVVVYAGAAPGTHIPYLAGLFPHLSFVLVDPAPFHCTANERIIVRQEFFTDATVRELREKYGDEILFISDIRTADTKTMNEEECEEAVQQDMQWQEQWVWDLDPVASLLKFRLPYGEGQSAYLPGRLFLPIWGPQTTTETRLLTLRTERQACRSILYDNRRYEEQMFYFNTVTRVQFYQHPVEGADMDHCYDCAAEAQLLRNYLLSLGPAENEDSLLIPRLVTISGNISEHCSLQGRTLGIAVKAGERKNWFSPRRYDPKRGLILAAAPKTSEQPDHHYAPRALKSYSETATKENEDSPSPTKRLDGELGLPDSFANNDIIILMNIERRNNKRNKSNVSRQLQAASEKG